MSRQPSAHSKRWARVRCLLYGIILSAASAWTSESAACSICIGFPPKTDADFLVESSCAVLARLHPDDRFRYSVRDVLKGTYDGSEFDLLVDSATRRILELDEERHVLLVQDKPHGEWRSLGPIHEPFAALVRRLLAASAEWTGPNAAERRWQFFQPLFGSSDERIAELAYLEMGRAPYSVVRQLGRMVGRETFVPRLENRRYLEWHGLAILLLAQSNAATDRQRILDSFQTAERLGANMNLAAWAAAAIEIEPQATLDQIEDRYVRRDGRSPAELKAIVQALSLHGSQPDSALRERIVASYGVLLKRSPQLAPAIANDLLAWRRTEWTELLAEISQQPETLDVAGTQAVQRYLRAAVALKSSPASNSASSSASAATTGRSHD